MKKLLISFILAFLVVGSSLAQNADKKAKKDNSPVSSPWDTEMLIDNQTTLDTPAKTLEVYIQHRFGMVNTNHIQDLYGIYAPGANVRLAINYTPIKHLTLGYGLTKTKMYSDFSAKYILFQQTKSNSMPVGVALYGVAAIDGRSNDNFGENYKFANRYSYFGELLVSRKFCNYFSLEAVGNFTHYNMVPVGGNHDVIGLGFTAAIKFTSQSSIILQYNTPLKIQKISEQTSFTAANSSKPNFGIGYEVNTGMHSFQIYLTTASGIIPQECYMYNQNDWTKGGLMLGFTITRLWNF
jgi:hypothetical protein